MDNVTNIMKILKLALSPGPFKKRFSFTVIAVVMAFSCLSSNVSALVTDPGVFTPFLTPDASACSSTSSDSTAETSPSTPTGSPPASASDALKAQPTLEPKWQSIILEDANKYGADPLVMASVLFWEHRSFPEYKSSGWAGSPSSGEGPWQFTAGTWSNYGGNVQDPVDATKAAAQFIKGLGGKSGAKGGSIEQDFSQGTNLETLATVVKSYNAGGGTYRSPGVAQYKQNGRLWYEGAAGPWNGDKQTIIDDYVVGATYAYYQIATGQPVTYKDNDSYVAEALTKQTDIKNFTFGGPIGDIGEDSNGNCISNSCTPSGGPGETSDGKATIVLDPGHVPGNTPKDERDSLTGLYVYDYESTFKERHNAYQVSLKIGKILEADGYNVVNSKISEDDKFNLAERAAKDNAANPTLIVVLHGDGSATELMYPDSKSHREPGGGARKDGTNGMVHSEINAPSKNYADIIAPIVAQSIPGYTAKSFYESYGSDGLGGNKENTGNTPVQTILSKYPEVYSEVTLDDLGSDTFAKAMAAGIEKAVPIKKQVTKAGNSNFFASVFNKITGTRQAHADDITSDCSGGAVAGSIIETAINYAWPTSDYNRKDPKLSYKTAFQKYNTSTKDPTDCGGFVATVMHASGADLNYVGVYVPNQYGYVTGKGKSKYTVIPHVKDTSLLRAGDILVYINHNNPKDSHTFIYVGGGNKGFNGDGASASLGGHVPIAVSTAGSFAYNNRAASGDYMAVRLN